METSAKSSVIGLVGGLTSDIKTFIQDEIRLAKTELSEKVSQLSKNGIFLVAGGLVAYIGAIVFFIGVGFVVAFGIEKAGVNPVLAIFIGEGCIGLLLAAIGGALALKAIATFRKTSVAPEKTLATLQELRTGGIRVPRSDEADAPTSDEMQEKVERTEGEMSEKLEELGYRLSPSHIKAEVKTKIQAKPYSYSLVAMGLGLISGLFLTRKSKA